MRPVRAGPAVERSREIQRQLQTFFEQRCADDQAEHVMRRMYPAADLDGLALPGETARQNAFPERKLLIGRFDRLPVRNRITARELERKPAHVIFMRILAEPVVFLVLVAGTRGVGNVAHSV